MNRPGRMLIVVGIAGLVVVLLAAIVPLPLQIAVGLIAGWFVFLRDTLPRVTVDRTQLLIAGVALAAFVGGLHLLLRRGVPPRLVGGRPWPWRATAAVTGLVLAMFVAGTGLVGIAHQIGWLATSPEPIFERDTFRKKVLTLQEERRLASEEAMRAAAEAATPGTDAPAAAADVPTPLPGPSP